VTACSDFIASLRGLCILFPELSSQKRDLFKENEMERVLQSCMNYKEHIWIASAFNFRTVGLLIHLNHRVAWLPLC
jgi:hypothetical protein